MSHGSKDVEGLISLPSSDNEVGSNSILNFFFFFFFFLIYLFTIAATAAVGLVLVLGVVASFAGTTFLAGLLFFWRCMLEKVW